MRRPHVTSLRSLFALASLASLAACAGSGETAVTPPQPLPPTVATVTVTAASTTPLLPGATVQLTAKALTAAGAEVPTASITWNSATASIATVSTTGLVTAVGAGSTAITASSGSATGSLTVQVNPGGIVGTTGGTVTAAGGAVTLQLPAGALTATTAITVTPKPDTVRTEHSVGSAYFFGPTGTTFAQPVTIALKYDSTQLPRFTPKSALRVARLTNGKWEPLTESVVVDSATKTVRAATRSFSVYSVVRDPCTPFTGATGTIVGQISTADCLFTTDGRRSDYYTLSPTDGEVVVLRGSGDLDGLFGLKEATNDPTTGTVWNSNSTIQSDLRLLSNGDPLQLFVSGRDSTKLGTYSLALSSGTTESVSHECVTSTNGKSYIMMMPGTTMRGTIQAANSCEIAIQAGNPAAIGKPLRVHYYPVKLVAGTRYTITGSGFAPQSSLSVFRSGLVGQDITTGSTRSVTITPPSTGYYFIEVGSGGFQNANFTGNWIQPVFTFTVSVSR